MSHDAATVCGLRANNSDPRPAFACGPNSALSGGRIKGCSLRGRAPDWLPPPARLCVVRSAEKGESSSARTAFRPARRIRPSLPHARPPAAHAHPPAGIPPPPSRSVRQALCRRPMGRPTSLSWRAAAKPAGRHLHSRPPPVAQRRRPLWRPRVEVAAREERSERALWPPLWLHSIRAQSGARRRPVCPIRSPFSQTRAGPSPLPGRARRPIVFGPV